MIEKINQEKKYSSLYLVEQINVFREQDGNKSVLRHSDFLRKLEKEFSEEIAQRNISPSSYVDSSGKKSKCYELIFEESLQLLMSESKTVRKGVILVLKEQQKQIEELKNNALPDFNNPAEMARIWADQYEQNQLKDGTIQGLEQALDVSEDWISILRASQEYGVKETFFKWRELKEYSRKNGIEVKKAPCPRFGTKNLYHVSVFKKVYNIKK